MRQVVDLEARFAGVGGEYPLGHEHPGVGDQAIERRCVGEQSLGKGGDVGEAGKVGHRGFDAGQLGGQFGEFGRRAAVRHEADAAGMQGMGQRPADAVGRAGEEKAGSRHDDILAPPFGSVRVGCRKWRQDGWKGSGDASSNTALEGASRCAFQPCHARIKHPCALPAGQGRQAERV